MRKSYLTGIEALNFHHYDWHKSGMDYTYKYPEGVRKWSNLGIENNIANPIRAYLDYLYYNIKFLKRVPNMKIEMFLFDTDEKEEILAKIDTDLTPILTAEEKEILKKFKEYLKGGDYDPSSKLTARRKAKRQRAKALGTDAKSA